MNKKGFFAVSLIYSFFIVFLALMVMVLAQSVNSRILVSRVKEDIRDDISNTRDLFVSKIKDGYMVGDTIFLAGEEWMVFHDQGDSYTLLLNRALTKSEIVRSLGLSTESDFTIENGAKVGYDASEFYGTCEEESDCQVRACRNYPSGIEYCYLYTNDAGNTLENFHRNPTWKWRWGETEDKGNFGTMIVSKIVNVWFEDHQGLQRLSRAHKFVGETVAPFILDGTSLGEEHKITGFVRLPYSTEFEGLPILVQNKLKTISPIHLTDVASGLQVKFYNRGSIENVYSNMPAYIRPVIEVLKDRD